jgi:hypothetical protein
MENKGKTEVPANRTRLMPRIRIRRERLIRPRPEEQGQTDGEQALKCLISIVLDKGDKHD